MRYYKIMVPTIKLTTPITYHRRLLQCHHQQPYNSHNNNNNNNKQALKQEEQDQHQKRRRRSSLLRRSASESMLVDSKKKLFRMVGAGDGPPPREVREEPTWSSSHRIANKDGVILSLNRMDVILTSSRDALDPNSQSVGNNRLHILVAMQSGKYQQATIDGREAILDEVIQTVKTFWKGRFLTESGSDGYEMISKDDARNALRSIFEMRSSQNLLSRQVRNNGESPIIPDHNLAHSARSPVKVMPSISSSSSDASAAISVARKHPPPSGALFKQSSTSMIPSMPSLVSRNANAALARQVSSSVLPTEPPAVLFHDGTGDDLRSAAVRSLQKQKARQTIASRLEKATMSSRNNLQQQHSNGIHPAALSAVGGATTSTSTTRSFMDLDPVVERTHYKSWSYIPVR